MFKITYGFMRMYCINALLSMLLGQCCAPRKLSEEESLSSGIIGPSSLPY
jgi:hypothetical protein